VGFRALVLSLSLAFWSNQCFAQGAPAETVAGDQRWEAQMANGPCQKLRDRLTDPPSIVAACQALGASQPPCEVYKAYAQIWFDMRLNRDPVLSYQPQMIGRLGQGTDEVLADKSPELRGHLQRLLSATLAADPGQWQAPDKWAAMAYSRCMAGQFL
jgi:hypothetical protein